MPPKFTAEQIHAAFWSRVQKTPGCWLWTGARKNTGYGAFAVWGRQVPAHRWAYQELIGPIPDGLQIDHLCRTRACVRPNHLESVTQQENLRRGEGIPAKRARQTHCIYGHAFDEANTLLSPKGRSCRACNREKARARYRSHLAAGLTAQGTPRVRGPYKRRGV